MASNYEFPLVQLDVPVIFNGRPLTHGAVTEVQISPRPNGNEVVFIQIYFGELISNVWVPEETRNPEMEQATQAEFWALANVMASGATEKASHAIMRAATEWAVSKGHLVGTIV